MTPDETKALADRFRKLYAGVIYDAIQSDYSAPFVIDRAIGKVTGPRRPLVGPAFTARGRQYQRACSSITEAAEALDTRHLRMFGDVSPGAVLVIDTGGDQVVAHFGDVSALLAIQAKAAGCVIDGYTRDVDRIEDMGFPLFARGATPQDAMGDWGVIEYGEALSLPGTTGAVRIHSGDWIFADRDGAQVIPRDMVVDVLAAAEQRAENEKAIVRAIADGESPIAVYKRLGQW